MRGRVTTPKPIPRGLAPAQANVAQRTAPTTNKSPSASSRASQPRGLDTRGASATVQRHRAKTHESSEHQQRVAVAQRAAVLKKPVVVQRHSAPKPFSRVVQATKIYPNLHPGAIEPIDPNNIFRLNSFANQYRLHKVHSHGVNVPNQQYNFVRTREGEMLLHARYRHPSIAEGKHVLYAGEIFFNNGQLEWWSNGSGHYQPDAGDAEQANLPMDQFFSYQQVIKGEHKRKRS